MVFACLFYFLVLLLHSILANLPRCSRRTTCGGFSLVLASANRYSMIAGHFVQVMHMEPHLQALESALSMTLTTNDLKPFADMA